MIQIKKAKTSYGELKNLDVAKASYIAGLIDGEGTISLIKIHKNEFRRLVVHISNSDLNLLVWVQKSIGVGQISKKNPRNKSHSMGYTYKICSRQAFNLLIQVFPYLKTYKKERAKLILKNYIKLTPRNGKYRPKVLKNRGKFIKDFFSIPCVDKLNTRFSPFIQDILVQ